MFGGRSLWCLGWCLRCPTFQKRRSRNGSQTPMSSSKHTEDHETQRWNHCCWVSWSRCSILLLEFFLQRSRNLESTCPPRSRRCILPDNECVEIGFWCSNFQKSFLSEASRFFNRFPANLKSFVSDSDSVQASLTLPENLWYEILCFVDNVSPICKDFSYIYIYRRASRAAPLCHMNWAGSVFWAAELLCLKPNKDKELYLVALLSVPGASSHQRLAGDWIIGC